MSKSACCISEAGGTSGLARPVQSVSTQLTWPDHLAHCKVRWNLGRMGFSVEPGLYAVGQPSDQSPVLVTANYRLTFDYLRRELTGLDTWILVLDTQGINVWCAAGKGTFGTDELVQRMQRERLAERVTHGQIILPQLGAVGVAAHEVKAQTGFQVVYGPVYARDIKAFLNAGLKATQAMRCVHFTFYERLVLTPVEIMLSLKYLAVAGAVFMLLSGWTREGYTVSTMLQQGPRVLGNLGVAFISGACLGPALLPWLPGRRFAVKGMFMGFIAALALTLVGLGGSRLEAASWFLLVMSISSFLTMNFTGASTYTSLSGVEREMRTAVPAQLIGLGLGAVLWIVSLFF
jgi:hypothetical protein